MRNLELEFNKVEYDTVYKRWLGTIKEKNGGFGILIAFELDNAEKLSNEEMLDIVNPAGFNFELEDMDSEYIEQFGSLLIVWENGDGSMFSQEDFYKYQELIEEY